MLVIKFVVVKIYLCVLFFLICNCWSIIAGTGVIAVIYYVEYSTVFSLERFQISHGEAARIERAITESKSIGFAVWFVSNLCLLIYDILNIL